MTALRQLITAQIAANGPIPVSEYMQLCLLHPAHGYYATRDPLGAAGDFTTAPEISQMFGEMIGLSLAQAWIDQGRPAPFTLAEAGPGRGTLMADILRATRGVPGFHGALHLHLIEASPVLRAAQSEKITSHPIRFHDSTATLPDQPLYLVANEFFDALPIRQMQRSGNGWRERCVGVTDGTLGFGLSDVVALPALRHRQDDTADGDIVELCPMASMAAQEIGQRIADHGGVALIIDYGDWRSLGDTLQALKAHKTTDPLAEPGQADLTAHVDFEALARATPTRYSRLSTQGVFLERLGITRRAQALAEKLTGKALENHIAAHRRLTHPQEMGTLFKAIAFYPDGATPPPGLEQ